MSYSSIVFLFLIYSFIGWGYEEVYCSIQQKKLVNRGFLHGPYCPIYGVGGLTAWAILSPFSLHPVLMFFLSILIFTTIEYLTSYILERLFGLRWWDYSSHKFNLNGRVCLSAALVFGVMGMVMFYGLNPMLIGWIDRIPANTARVASSLLSAAFLFDVVYTTADMFHLSEKLKKTQQMITQLKQLYQEEGWYDQADIGTSLDRLSTLCASEDDSKETTQLIAKIRQDWNKDKRASWLLKVFLDIRQNRLSDAITWAQTTVSTDRLRNFLHVTKKSETMSSKEQTESFARGLNFYKLFWVFCICSVIGYVLETLYYLLTKGFIESRQGLLYGPFSQIYGLGAIVMMLVLSRFASRKNGWIFVGGALVGGAFEWICSFVQEKALGTVSWQYSAVVGGLGGRTSLLYMIFWGVLAVFLLRIVFPRLNALIEKIPNKQGVLLSWILIVILSADIAVSTATVYRWRQRDNAIAPRNVVEQYLDDHYPNEFMKNVYPNMNMK